MRNTKLDLHADVASSDFVTVMTLIAQVGCCTVDNGHFDVMAYSELIHLRDNTRGHSAMTEIRRLRERMGSGSEIGERLS